MHQKPKALNARKYTNALKAKPGPISILVLQSILEDCDPDGRITCMPEKS